MSGLMKRNYTEMILDEQSLKKLNEFSRTVLGEEYYDRVEEFFKEIWRSEAKYKVFIARKCLNLMYTIYKCSGQKNINTDSFYSDRAILANVPEIAEYYLRFGVIPEIILVDDILIHGRAINLFLRNFVSAILKYCKENEAKYDKVTVQGDLVRAVHAALTIKVMVRSSKSFLLDENYISCLDSKAVWHPQLWRELSSRIAILISEGIFAYTSYVLSLYEINEQDREVHKYFIEAAKKLGFSELESKYIDRTTLIKPLHNENNDVVAFYTLRVTRNNADGNYRVTPFVMMADMSFDGKFAALSELGFDNYISGCDSIYESLRSRAEGAYLILSHNLLLLFQEEIRSLHGSELRLIRPEALDIEKISFCFRKPRFSDDEDFFDKLISYDRPFMTWDDMNKFIMNGTRESEPLFVYDIKETVSEKSLEEILVSEGEQNESLAYEQDMKRQPKSLENTDLSIKKLFDKTGLVLKNSSDGIVGVIEELLRYMDLGIVSVSAVFERGEQRRSMCVYHSGEQSLYVLPTKYARYLPVLADIEDDCSCNPEQIKQRVREFYSERPGIGKTTADELVEFVDRIYFSGQRLVDWNINLLKMDPINRAVKVSGCRFNSSVSEFSKSETFRNSIGQLLDLMSYHQKYQN